MVAFASLLIKALREKILWATPGLSNNNISPQNDGSLTIKSVKYFKVLGSIFQVIVMHHFNLFAC